MSLDWIFKFNEYISGFLNQTIFQKGEHMKEYQRVHLKFHQ